MPTHSEWTKLCTLRENTARGEATFSGVLAQIRAARAPSPDWVNVARTAWQWSDFGYVTYARSHIITRGSYHLWGSISFTVLGLGEGAEAFDRTETRAVELQAKKGELTSRVQGELNAAVEFFLGSWEQRGLRGRKPKPKPNDKG